MADNAQKTPYGLSINRFARAKALDQIAQTGRSLPCQVVKVMGSIVQVAFQITAQPGQTPITIPNVTIPIIGFEYARPPIQVGCKGFTIAADAYLGGMSGIGGGTATTTQMGNLTALAFAPVSNSGWTTVDGNAYVIYGPNGVVLRDSGSAVVFTLTPSGIAITGNVTITGNITATGAVVAGQGGADQVGLQTHKHGTGTPAAGTSVPTAGT